jgi:hypothetical protein
MLCTRATHEEGGVRLVLSDSRNGDGELVGYDDDVSLRREDP